MGEEETKNKTFRNWKVWLFVVGYPFRRSCRYGRFDALPGATLDTTFIRDTCSDWPIRSVATLAEDQTALGIMEGV